MRRLILLLALTGALAAAEPVRVDCSKPDSTWPMPALAASDPAWHQPLQPYTWETPRVDVLAEQRHSRHNRTHHSLI